MLRNLLRASARNIKSGRGFSTSQTTVAEKVEAVSKAGSPWTTFMARHATKVKVGAAMGFGYYVGTWDEQTRSRVLPITRSCCETPELTESQAALTDKLKGLVGAEHVIGEGVGQSSYVIGSRIGKGSALAVVRPGTIEEAIAVLEECVKADVLIIPQGANTGLTGGSVPRNGDTSRPFVIISMRRLDGIHLLGDKALCLAGAGIFDLQERVKATGRESHSVLGSIFLNPSVAAGLSFGSGGTQVRKGPVYSERVLYCRVTKTGQVEVVNTLGIKAKDNAELFAKLQAGNLSEEDLDPRCRLPASDTSYRANVCKVNGDVSRCNADTRGPDPCRRCLRS